MTAWAELRDVPYQGVPVDTVKRHATGKGDAGKEEMIAAARARGFNPTDDSEADALAILHWVIETRGGFGERRGDAARGGEDREAAAAGLWRGSSADGGGSQRWSITLGQPVMAAQVVLCLIDLKLARLGHDPQHADSILDAAGYAAVLQEISR